MTRKVTRLPKSEAWDHFSFLLFLEVSRITINNLPNFKSLIFLTLILPAQLSLSPYHLLPKQLEKAPNCYLSLATGKAILNTATKVTSIKCMAAHIPISLLNLPFFPHCLFKMCKYFYITYRALYRRLLQLHHLSSLLIPLHSDNIEWLIVLFHTFYPNCCFCLKYLPLFLPLFYLSSRLSTSVSSTRKPSKTSLGWAKYCPLSFHIYCACYAPCSYHTVVKLFTCTSKAGSRLVIGSQQDAHITCFQQIFVELW